MKFEMIQLLLCYLLDHLTNKYSRVWSSMINFVHRFSKTKEDWPSCTLGQGVEIKTLQHENESSNRIQYNNTVKDLVKGCRNRIQYVSQQSSCQQEGSLITNYSFQEKKCGGLWCCLIDHVLLKNFFYGMIP